MPHITPLTSLRTPSTTTQLGFALAIAGAVFITVPRGVSIGEVCVRPSRMSWNTTKSTYQLKLLAMVPVYNPNYLKVGAHDLLFVWARRAGRATPCATDLGLGTCGFDCELEPKISHSPKLLPGQAHIEGELRVLFYNTEAGKQSMGSVKLPARSSPAVGAALREVILSQRGCWRLSVYPRPRLREDLLHRVGHPSFARRALKLRSSPAIPCRSSTSQSTPRMCHRTTSWPSSPSAPPSRRSSYSSCRATSP